MPQFLIAPEAVTDEAFRLTGDEARHAAQVMRVRAGDSIELFDGAGRRWKGRVESADRDSVTGAVTETLAEVRPRLRLHLYPALLQRERFELLLEKGTELGVAAFTPVLTERTVARAKDDKRERWQKVVLAAAKQCGVPRLPETHEPVRFADALRSASGLKLLAWEGKATRKVAEALAGLPAGADVHVFIGPEGGFSDAEVSTAEAAGAKTFTLGSTVLRAETAAIAAASLILLS